MITKSEFLNQVHGRIFPLLKKCEMERVDAIKKCFKIPFLCICFPVLFLVWYVGLETVLKSEFFSILIFSILVIPVIAFSIKLNKFSFSLKQKFLPIICDVLGFQEIKPETGIVHEKVGKIPENLKDIGIDSTNPIEYKIINWTNLNLFSNDVDDFCYDDCLIYKDNSLSFFEYNLSKGSGKRCRIIFQGPVVEFKADIKLEERILIFQKLGIFSNEEVKIQKDSNYQKFQTNDVVFDKEFSVYAQNEIEAKSLLNKVFLRQILAVKELYPKAIVNFLIENGKITVSINTGKNMFEFFSITHSLLQDKFFEKFYDEINTIYKVKELFQ